MRTPWIEERKLEAALRRNTAFWRGELEEYPVMWVTVESAKPGPLPPRPNTNEEQWTNVEYVVDAAEAVLARRHYGGDALPVYNPWLGPDQFAAWLGAEIHLFPQQFTSWVTPFVDDWDAHPDLHIEPQNRWWRLYQDVLKACVERGSDKWVTAYPDLHSGIDALSAIRGPERLAMDLVTSPDAIKRAMRQMTILFKYVVDVTSEIILPAGQGTSNWTMGWSDNRYLCIGQNDFTGMIGTGMFREFCLTDSRETAEYVDVSLLHLDGPGMARHLDAFLEIDALNCVQWIQGAGAPPPSQWIRLLRRIQDSGKSVQVFYGGAHGGDADLYHELTVLCDALDPCRLFFWAEAKSVEEAEALVAHARKVCAEKRRRRD